MKEWLSAYRSPHGAIQSQSMSAAMLADRYRNNPNPPRALFRSKRNVLAGLIERHHHKGDRVIAAARYAIDALDCVIAPSNENLPARCAKNGETEKTLRKLFDIETDDCILWPLGMSDQGYGSATVQGVRIRAHRQVCIWAFGDPVGEANQAAHSCANRSCVNKRHLRWATIAENNRDKLADGTQVRGQRVGSAKLSEPEVLEILQASLDGERQVDIARRFGVSRACIYRITSGMTWRHLTTKGPHT